ncbi:TRAP transporter large permease [Pseudonocardia sichuanensis]
MTVLLLFGTFLLLLLIGVPVAFALGASAVTTILYLGFFSNLAIVPSVMFASLSAETLLAIPFFILAGAIMEFAGISQRLIDFADACVGHFKHGLAMVVVIAAFFFSAISGSGPATVAAIGTILIPALIRRGYAKRHATALVASAGSMGIVVPPSIAFIIFAVVVSDLERVSIARLFMAGVVPGVLMALAMLVVCVFLPRNTALRAAEAAPAAANLVAGPGGTRSGGGSGAGPLGSDGAVEDAGTGPRVGDRRRTSMGEIGRATLRAVPGLMVPVIIMGGIYGGVFTPTESAVVAAAYALVVGLLVYRGMSLAAIPRIFTTAAVQSATVMLIVGSASVFSYVITANKVAETVSTAMLGLSDNKYVLLFIVVVLLLVVGMFMDAVSALYLFVPILAPVLLEVGVDVTTIGVLMVVNLAVGLITPPVGVNLFVAAGAGKVTLTEVLRGVWPFLLACLAVLLLVTYVPQLSNWLPDLLGM